MLRPKTALELELRLPALVDGHAATVTMKPLLESDPPHGAKVTFVAAQGATGWNAPATRPWLGKALDDASRAVYGKQVAAMGEGGTIPFMAMLGGRFPDAQFLVTGVLGPGSNAHGPNEFLHLATGRRVTAAVARLLDAHASR